MSALLEVQMPGNPLQFLTVQLLFWCCEGWTKIGILEQNILCDMIFLCYVLYRNPCLELSKQAERPWGKESSNFVNFRLDVKAIWYITSKYCHAGPSSVFLEQLPT